MAEFKKYRRTNIAEMKFANWTDFEVPNRISVSETDAKEVAAIIDRNVNYAGMIARNPKNHKDQWYVARQYFEDNFEEVD